jgi:hypothetical protein
MTVERYVITIGTPNGPGVLEVPTTLGPEAAGRRALAAAMAIGWGEPDELTVEQVEAP